MSLLSLKHSVDGFMLLLSVGFKDTDYFPHMILRSFCYGSQDQSKFTCEEASYLDGSSPASMFITFYLLMFFNRLMITGQSK